MRRNQASPVSWHNYIVIDRSIAHGQPMVNGTDLPVENILLELAQGHPAAAIIERHPQLTPEVMQAIYRFAARSVQYRYPGPTPEDVFDGPEWTTIDP